MGFLDKVVDVLGFVEREEYEEETPAEKVPQQTPKVTAIPVKCRVLIMWFLLQIQTENLQARSRKGTMHGLCWLNRFGLKNRRGLLIIC